MFKNFILFASLFLVACHPNPETENKDNLVSTSIQYLEDHWQTPEEYVVSKFDNHDIVFIGEWHRILHDVELIHRLIPKLYEAGIFNLGIEFANFVDQPKIDSLISSEIYDEQLANQIQFEHWPWWGYKEYVDIYRAAWNLNKSLMEGSRPFRVIGLTQKTDWSLVWTVEDRNNLEIMKKVFPKGDPRCIHA